MRFSSAVTASSVPGASNWLFWGLHRIPATYATREIAEAGGLMCYGSNVPDAWRQVGVYTGRILKGGIPAAKACRRETAAEGNEGIEQTWGEGKFVREANPRRFEHVGTARRAERAQAEEAQGATATGRVICARSWREAHAFWHCIENNLSLHSYERDSEQDQSHPPSLPLAADHRNLDSPCCTRAWSARHMGRCGHRSKGESRGGSHRRALAEPDVRLAPHPAPIVRPRP